MFSNYDSSQIIYVENIPLNAEQYASLVRDIGERCHYRDWVIWIQPERDRLPVAYEYAFMIYELMWLDHEHI